MSSCGRRTAAFQSTHPCGVRLEQLMTGLSDDGVSIHAPLRGATTKFDRFSTELSSFNPRTPAGCDKGRIVFLAEYKSFNPRTPAGCDSRQLFSVERHLRFNPRTPAGCDPRFPGSVNLFLKVSIHAPLRGATGARHTYLCRERVSIHAPLRGATRFYLPRPKRLLKFQSTHPCGVRLCISLLSIIII